MKISPREVNKILRSDALANIRGIALYPENEMAVEASLFKVDGICYDLPFDEGMSAGDIEGMFVAQKASVTGIVFFRNAAKILARTELRRHIYEHMTSSFRGPLGLIFEPSLPGLSGSAWRDPFLQNRFIHIQVAPGIPLDVSPVSATQ